ncbi:MULTISPECIES: DeoR/GlpR family DNA-binding transcription regulator [Paenibacillus]|uniref:DeoR/GlpR family DNA-binding transcription regulator n=1 Tax=Paenibacillus polygoni TaxID=3050112 RepID=A0ABY8XCU9_9BACL|nr:MULTISPECIES: DeoR/GlpR family DNA-binding transcription regulator [Paenibacillus]WIV21280.1 DeoR/GlpR family DNA-binding transcription regulator [Paenibacillus polygoni]
MLAAERRQMIIDIANKDKRVLVSELSHKFQVTEETIRRDLEKLEKEGVLTRTYGGAIMNRHSNEDLPFYTRHATNLHIKQEIAQKALSYIHNGDTLMMDPSTSSIELLKILNMRQGLTVITSSIILQEFAASGHQIISTGGTLRAPSMSLVGTVAHETARKYHVDKFIMSCKALSLDHGIMDSNEAECELKRKMIQQAEQVILLADHTKFDRTAFVHLSHFDNIDVVITDQEPSDPWKQLFQEHEIELIY